MSPVGAQKHTPSKRPDRGGCRMMGRGIFFQAYRYIFDERAFVSSGDAWRAYAIRPYPTGKRCLLFIPTTFTTYPGFFVVRSLFFDVPCRAQKHTPSKRPDRGGCRTMGRAFFDVPRRGVSHTPSKRPDRGGCRTMGRGKNFQAGAFNMKGGGVAP